MLKGDILKEMAGNDFPDEGVPSKAIWNPSDSLSSSSLITSMSSSSDVAVEDVVDPATFASSTPAAFEAALPSADNPAEKERQMRIHEDCGSSEDGQASLAEDDDNRLGGMLMSSMNTAHGSEQEPRGSNDAKDSRDENKNNKLFGSTPDERHAFIDTLSHLNDKQLRIQLWDSFRLARVILGKPVKDKRKLSHKSILHAIRKVAEMKIQIIRMSEQVDKYRQREKKQQKRLQKSKIFKENTEGVASTKGAQKSGEDSSVSSSVLSPTLATNGDDGPDYATATMREHAIMALQAESNLALSQIHEINQRQRNQTNLLESPPTSPRRKGSPGLFLSPSESDDDYSYTDESAFDILHAFKDKRSPSRQKEMELARIKEANADADEIRRVLQRVVDFEQNQQQAKEPEITAEVRQELVALLMRLRQELDALLTQFSQTPPTATSPIAAAKASPQKTEMGAKQSPALKAKKGTRELPSNNSAEVPLKESLVEAQMNIDIVDEVEDEEIAECRARLSAAKVRQDESIEAHKHLDLQKELLQEDIAIARQNTTRNREKVQLQRLKGYKKLLEVILKEEEEQAKQMESLDAELNEMATVCVKLEDRESDFSKKHERHQAALNDFRTVTKRHTEKFRSLMRSIDNGIKEQTATVFGDKHKDGDTPSSGSRSFDVDNDTSAQKIQRLEYLLTKQNIEVFRLKAELKLKEGKSKEGKTRKGSSRIKWWC